MAISVVVASSRQNGHTVALVNSLVTFEPATVIDLSEKQLSYFDYEHGNKQDDFLPIISDLIGSEVIVFATPVYWYSMSAQLKVFIDRLTDLLTIEKEMGRALRGKRFAVIATGTDSELPACFTEQFQRIGDYLGMQMLPPLYCQCPDGFNESQHKVAISNFAELIKGY